MVVSVEAIIENRTYTLLYDSTTNLWTAEIEAPQGIKTGTKVSYYPIMLRVTDDGGNVTIKTISDVDVGDDLLLKVREEDLFPLRFIVANPEGKEQGFVDADVDMEITNDDSSDFEIITNIGSWMQEQCQYRAMIYIPGTEYGGLLEENKGSTQNGTVTWYGYTWRGLLTQKIIYPPEGETHKVVSGDANEIIKEVLEDQYGSLFFVPEESSGIEIEEYQFDRYTDILSGLQKMLEKYEARLKICFLQGGTSESGKVYVSAEKVVDWSEMLEYSQDGNVNFTSHEYYRGINHLVCAGEGEGTERLVIHLYVQEDGTIGTEQYYFGLDERTALYAYTSQDDEEKLIEDGTARLKDLMNYKEIEMTVEDIEVELGDIVGGRDYITGMEMKQPIVSKILKIKDGKAEIEYEVKGDE